MIRLVVTDLDGTFWDHDLRVPQSHSSAARDLLAAGVHVLVATSRRPRVVRPKLQEAGLLLPAVLLDGALGIDFRTEERFHEASFERDAALDVLSSWQEHGLDPCLYVEHPDVDVIVSATPSTCAAHLAYLGSVAATGNLAATAATSSIFAFSVLGLSQELLEPVAEALVATTTSSVVLYPEPDYGEYGLLVNPPGVTKWSGVAAYCRVHGIDADEVLAVGDGLNDLPMLQRAMVAVAVRGGTPAAVAAAHYLIDPPRENGWTQIVEIVRHN